MTLFYVIMGGMLIAGGILGFLFYTVRKETVKPVSVGPIAVPVQIKEPPEFQKRIGELEEELRVVSGKAVVQAQEAMTAIDTLTKENARLKAGTEQGASAGKAQLAELEQSLDRLRQDNSSLQGQLEAGQSKVRELQEEITAVRKHLGDELLAANAEITALKALPKPQPVPDDVLAANEHLRQEATKYRAQASGFERMCDNYKVQLEQALGRVQAMETGQVEMQAVKNRLEEVLREAAKQNEEFTKREKLSQFELEKTRSQLVALEKSYEEVKLKAQGPLPDGKPEGAA